MAKPVNETATDLDNVLFRLALTNDISISFMLSEIRRPCTLQQNGCQNNRAFGQSIQSLACLRYLLASKSEKYRMTTVQVRDLNARDETAWRNMWEGYCAFYKVTVSDDVTETLWLRLLDATSDVKAIVAEDENGKAAGLAHYIIHPYTWGLNSVCYLEDLFVNPAARGKGLGAALLDALIARGRNGAWDRLYWHTAENNTTARKLYDRYVLADQFVRYLVRLT
jgi:GNAT superfamily N-acetyltransferase